MDIFHNLNVDMGIHQSYHGYMQAHDVLTGRNSPLNVLWVSGRLAISFESWVPITKFRLRNFSLKDIPVVFMIRH